MRSYQRSYSDIFRLIEAGEIVNFHAHGILSYTNYKSLDSISILTVRPSKKRPSIAFRASSACVGSAKRTKIFTVCVSCSCTMTTLIQFNYNTNCLKLQKTDNTGEFRQTHIGHHSVF